MWSVGGERGSHWEGQTNWCPSSVFYGISNPDKAASRDCLYSNEQESFWYGLSQWEMMLQCNVISLAEPIARLIHDASVAVRLAATYRQCFSTLRLRAIFSPSSVQTGLVRPILARSAFSPSTRPPLDREPMFTIKISYLVNFCTWKQTSARVREEHIGK